METCLAAKIRVPKLIQGVVFCLVILMMNVVHALGCSGLYRPAPEDSAVPYVSVVMATYNRAHTIASAINSVRRQKFQNWELIIIDDGSKDNTSEIVEPFLKADPRIKYFRQDNAGQAAARNVGIKHSKGKFLSFLDSDDRYKNNYLSDRVAEVADSNLTFLYGGVHVLGSQVMPDMNNPERMINVNSPSVGLAGTFFVQRDVMLALGGFPDLRYAEDGALFKAAKQSGIPMKWIQSPSYVYDRRGEDSVTKAKARELPPSQ